MVKDVYFLVMHEPYDEPGAPVPVNGPHAAAPGPAAAGRRTDLPLPDGVPWPNPQLPGPAVDAQLRA